MITRKLKTCKTCGKLSYLFSKGRCKACASKEDYSPLNRLKLRKKPIIFTETEELDRWFQERREEMTGFCANCGRPSTKNSDQYYKFSIAHILPKAYFKSVATHPLNFIELCFFHNSCHANMDHGMLDMSEMRCFDIILKRFLRMYPHIALDERRRIPDVFLSYI